jgi:hypothetical protein
VKVLTFWNTLFHLVVRERVLPIQLLERLTQVILQEDLLMFHKMLSSERTTVVLLRVSKYSRLKRVRNLSKASTKDFSADTFAKISKTRQQARFLFLRISLWVMMKQTLSSARVLNALSFVQFYIVVQSTASASVAMVLTLQTVSLLQSVRLLVLLPLSLSVSLVHSSQ